MKLIINSEDFKHIPEKSCYNHNYYKYVGSCTVLLKEILVVCHEDHDFYEYSLIEDGKEVFIGCSVNGLEEDLIEIDFRKYYC